MRAKFIYRGLTDGEESHDDAEVTSKETAEQEIKDLIVWFNEGEKARYSNKGRPREPVQRTGFVEEK